MNVVIADHPQEDLSLEKGLLADAGMSVSVADPQCRTPGDVIRAAADADAIVAQYAPVTDEVMAALPRLRIVSLPLIGVDAVDTEAARRHGVWVANVPDACVTETAVHALAMALGLIRHLPFFDRVVRGGGWGYEATGNLRRPGNLTLGIVGLGNIGRHVAACAAPVFGRMVGFDPMVHTESWPAKVERADDLKSLFGESDVLTFHVPLTAQTRHLVGRELLAEARPGAYLVNASRGPVVDPRALLEALDSGHLAGAALDVFEKEPPDVNDRIRRSSEGVREPPCGLLLGGVRRRGAAPVGREHHQLRADRAPGSCRDRRQSNLERLNRSGRISGIDSVPLSIVRTAPFPPRRCTDPSRLQRLLRARRNRPPATQAPGATGRTGPSATHVRGLPDQSTVRVSRYATTSSMSRAL